MHKYIFSQNVDQKNSEKNVIKIVWPYYKKFEEIYFDQSEIEFGIMKEDWGGKWLRALFFDCLASYDCTDGQTNVT